MPRLSQDELKWKALLAVDEAIELATKGQHITKSLMLRFTLAYLYSVALPDSRPDFVQLWRLLTAPELSASPELQGRSSRLAHHYNRICIAIGWERTLTLMQYLSTARKLEKRVIE